MYNAKISLVLQKLKLDDEFCMQDYYRIYKSSLSSLEGELFTYGLPNTRDLNGKKIEVYHRLHEVFQFQVHLGVRIKVSEVNIPWANKIIKDSCRFYTGSLNCRLHHLKEYFESNLSKITSLYKHGEKSHKKLDIYSFIEISNLVSDDLNLSDGLCLVLKMIDKEYTYSFLEIVYFLLSKKLLSTSCLDEKSYTSIFTDELFLKIIEDYAKL